MTAPSSPDALRRDLVQEFLDSYRRPCACPLDVRAERDGLRCSSCDRLFVRRRA